MKLGMGEDAPPPDPSRRTFLVGTGSMVVGAGLGLGAAALVRPHHHGPTVWTQPERIGAPEVGGLHLQFGSDAARELVVSWHTTEAVANPRVLLGTPTGGFGHTAPA